MKPAIEQAQEFLEDHLDGRWDNTDLSILGDLLHEREKETRKDQDKITREACAHNVRMIECELEGYEGLIRSSDAYVACINVKAV